MGAHHTHDHDAPASRGTVRIVLAIIIPLALVTLGALIWLWPGDPAAAPGGSGIGLAKAKGTIIRIELKPCPGPIGGAPAAGEPATGQGEPGTAPLPTDPRRCGDAKVQLSTGPDAGGVVTTALPSGPGNQTFRAGQDVILVHVPDNPDGNLYQLSDHDRSNPMWLVGAAFALAVIAFGRWRGLTALIGLAITFVLLLGFLIPAILQGRPPLLVAVVCAGAIMLAVLYLTHGLTVRTSIAVIGTLASLALTGLLATAAIALTHVNGLTDDYALNLNLNYQINTQGLLLAGIIIGSLGVLDDVTVTQSATVGELARANPGYGFGHLYRAASRVGRAHIASVINTLVLAYVGAALPLLLVFNVGRQPLGEIITSPIIAQEIVRSVAGTLGLIAAVPITTALAALVQVRGAQPRPPEPETDEEDAAAPIATKPSKKPAVESELPPPGWPHTPAGDPN
jgi:uncharacterized membrane protein